AHAPHYILVEPVDQWIRAFKPAGALQIGVADHSTDIVGLQSAGPAFHLGIAESMEGEAWLPGLQPVAPQRVAIDGLRQAQRPRTQLAVLEDFRMAQGDRLSHFPADGQAEPTYEVLAEVNNGTPARRCCDGDRRDQFGAPNRRPGWCDERGKLSIELSHTGPIVVIIPGRRPARSLQTGIVRLTIIDVAGQNGCLCGTPGLVGDDTLACAVRVVDLELGQQREPVAIDVAAPTIEA